MIAVAAILVACGDGGPAGQLGAGGTTTTTTRASESTTTAAPVTAAPMTASPAAPPTTAAPAGGSCAVSGQSPPSGTVDADYPTALAFAPDGRLFWAERSGTVRVWQDGAAKEFASVAVTTSGERGLLGLAISPTFARDRYVYAFASAPDQVTQRVVRWTDCAGTGQDETTIVELPAGTTCCHKGGRIGFGPEGALYVTLGDLFSAPTAQDTSNVRGKVLRYNAGGSVPGDNPFGAGNPVWAYGIRNAFGLAFSPSGQLSITINGPTGDAGAPASGYDTVVVAVARGGNYQWPNCYGYSHPIAGRSCAGQTEPDWSSEESTVVPTGVTWVDGSGPASLAGKLVFCAYVGGMRILTPGRPHATVTTGPGGCQLDVKQGPDKAVYYSDPGAIYRMG